MSNKIKFDVNKNKYNKTKKLIENFLRERNIEKIKNIIEKFGLNYNIQFDIEIVSAEIKYIFNYLSGAFKNKDLQKGAKNMEKFLDGNSFNESIKHFSGRAIYDKKVIKKVLLSLSYLEDSNSEFVPLIKNLCNKIMNKIKCGKSVIVIGISRNEKVSSFDRLLVHEIFHLVLFNNGIIFENIDRKYAKLDEGLAIFLSYIWSGNAKKILEIKNDFDRKATIFWYKKLFLVPSGREAKKIKEIEKCLKL